MVAIPVCAQADPTLAAADAALVERSRREKRRTYLGLSALGGECERKLWYSYHEPQAEEHDALTLKRFADGHASEDVIVERLRMAPGVTLMSVDPDTGRQIAVQDMDGRLRGNLDGVIHGLHQAPSTWHVFEAKSSNEKSFAKLIRLKAEVGEKQALAKWNPTYHTQAQGYMGYTGLKRHYLVCCTPGVRDWTSVRTDFDPAAFDALKDKARRILEARVPLARVSKDPSWFLCRMCHYAPRCHGGAA